jgi:hypothetical protein
MWIKIVLIHILAAVVDLLGLGLRGRIIVLWVMVILIISLGSDDE